MNEHLKFMSLALKEAKKAETIDEVPVGCVIVNKGKVISRGFNKKENSLDPLGHAEIIAIRKACKKIHNWRLEGCELYVTLEPCIMCAGAIIQSRIEKVYFGAFDFKGGAFGSSIDVLKADHINHHPSVTSGIMQEECSTIISSYFKRKRAKHDE